VKRNTDVIVLRLPEQDKENIQKAAAEDQMYVSEFIRDAVRQALRRRETIQRKIKDIPNPQPNA